MMGRLNHDQGQLFYSFSLEEAVPDDHLVREIAAVRRSRVRATIGSATAISSAACSSAW